MARLIFTAHDPGGAMMMGAGANSVIKAGHEVHFFGSGPAIDIWRKAGFDVLEMSSGFGFHWSTTAPIDVLVTGTGFGDFEQSCWVWAKAKGCPILAVIDSWTGLRRRFDTSNGPLFPDAIGVVDISMSDLLLREVDTTAKILVIGQPHLRRQTKKLWEIRSQQNVEKEIPTFVFFSEPILEDFGLTERGFDQFGVFKKLLSTLDSEITFNLIVKPHPRECSRTWQQLIETCQFPEEVSLCLSSASTEKLLTITNGVIGITTMVLLEAHLLGVPVLSLQPERSFIANPVIEEIAEPVTRSIDLKTRCKEFLEFREQKTDVCPKFRALVGGNDRCFVDAIERMIH